MLSATSPSVRLIAQTNQLQIPEAQRTEAILLITAIFMIVVPLAMFFLKNQHRWLVVLALNVAYIVSYLIGGWPAVIAAVVASFLAILLSAALLRHAYDESTWDTFTYQIRLALGRANDIQIIEDGKTVVPAKASTLLGPRQVIVKPFNAVVLEQGGKQTDVRGPGAFHTKSFEYVKYIVDLRPKQVWLSIQDVETTDFFMVQAAVYVAYRIDIREKSILGNASSVELLEPEKQTVLRLALLGSDLERVVNSAIEATMRQLIGTTTMADLLAGSTKVRLEKLIQRLVQDRMRGHHIIIDQVILQNIQPSQEVVSSLTERAEALALAQILPELAQAYNRAKQLGMPEAEINEYLYQRAWEHVAKSWKARSQ